MKWCINMCASMRTCRYFTNVHCATHLFRHWCFVMEWFIFRPMSNVFILRLCNIYPFSLLDTTSRSFVNCSYRFSFMTSLIICTHLYTYPNEYYNDNGTKLIPL